MAKKTCYVCGTEFSIDPGIKYMYKRHKLCKSANGKDTYRIFYMCSYTCYNKCRDGRIKRWNWDRNPVMDIFSYNIRLLLAMHGWTYSDLSRELGKSTGIVNAWVYKIALPKEETVKDICDIFQVKREDLFSKKIQVVLPSEQAGK